MLGRLRPEGTHTVLDAGCGSGRVTEALLERLPRARVVALDASSAMLAQAEERLGRFGARVRFVHCDLLHLTPGALAAGRGGDGVRGADGAEGASGGDGVVDAVVSTATFHWVTDHDRLFTNLARVLRPGGQLVAQCGAHGNLQALLAVVADLGGERRGTWHYATTHETVARLERAGFSDISVWTNPEPTTFASAPELSVFLEKVVLRDHLASMTPERRSSFLAAVVAALPAPVLDYVRLNITARRSSARAVPPGE